jgi:hypothetical protein
MNKGLFILLFLTLSLFSFGQNSYFGLSFGIYDYFYYGDGIVGNWLLEANTSVVKGKTIEVNHKLNLNHFYVKSQFTFCYNIGSISLTNQELERDYEGNHILRTMGGLNEMHFGLSSMGGIQFALKQFNFRCYAGLTPSFLVKEISIDDYVAPWDEINKSIYRSYNSFVLYGDWGIGIDYWKFSLDLRRENNLTPIIGNINYEGGNYEYNYSTKRLFLILGFNFYPWKIKDHSPKPLI